MVKVPRILTTTVSTLPFLVIETTGKMGYWKDCKLTPGKSSLK